MSLAGLPEGNGDSRAWRAAGTSSSIRECQGGTGQGGMSSTRVRVKDVGRTRAKLDKD